jgi:hypothetical protein
MMGSIEILRRITEVDSIENDWGGNMDDGEY